MRKRSKSLSIARRSFETLVGVLVALDWIWLALFLVLVSIAALTTPLVLARDLAQAALIVPAVLVISLFIACIAAVAVAWAHRGLRWWYFAALILVSATITQVGRAYLNG